MIGCFMLFTSFRINLDSGSCMYVSNLGVSKYIPHFCKGIHWWFYALKNKLLHFLCRFIKASMREKIYLLTFSADLQALCTPATKLFLNTSSLIQRNKIKDLSEYAFNFLHFSYKRTKNPLTYTKEFRGTLSTKISHLLQIVYKRRKNTSHF